LCFSQDSPGKDGGTATWRLQLNLVTAPPHPGVNVTVAIRSRASSGTPLNAYADDGGDDHASQVAVESHTVTLQRCAESASAAFVELARDANIGSRPSPAAWTRGHVAQAAAWWQRINGQPTPKRRSADPALEQAVRRAWTASYHAHRSALADGSADLLPAPRPLQAARRHNGGAVPTQPGQTRHGGTVPVAVFAEMAVADAPGEALPSASRVGDVSPDLGYHGAGEPPFASGHAPPTQQHAAPAFLPPPSPWAGVMDWSGVPLSPDQQWAATLLQGQDALAVLADRGPNPFISRAAAAHVLLETAAGAQADASAHAGASAGVGVGTIYEVIIHPAINALGYLLPRLAYQLVKDILTAVVNELLQEVIKPMTTLPALAAMDPVNFAAAMGQRAVDPITAMILRAKEQLLKAIPVLPVLPVLPAVDVAAANMVGQVAAMAPFPPPPPAPAAAMIQVGEGVEQVEGGAALQLLQLQQAASAELRDGGGEGDGGEPSGPKSSLPMPADLDLRIEAPVTPPQQLAVALVSALRTPLEASLIGALPTRVTDTAPTIIATALQNAVLGPTVAAVTERVTAAVVRRATMTVAHQLHARVVAAVTRNLTAALGLAIGSSITRSPADDVLCAACAASAAAAPGNQTRTPAGQHAAGAHCGSCAVIQRAEASLRRLLAHHAATYGRWYGDWYVRHGDRDAMGDMAAHVPSGLPARHPGSGAGGDRMGDVEAAAALSGVRGPLVDGTRQGAGRRGG
jgi:hypothetical protein